MSIKENLSLILSNIEKAKKRSLTNENVELIAVSKMHDFSEIVEAHENGQIIFGENKVQELRGKIDKKIENNLGIKFHMIGNLQTNKVKYIYNKVDLIQSVDRENLLKEIDNRAKNDNIIVDCLVEVNIANEHQKGGVEYSKVESFIELCNKYENVSIKGLMTVAPNTNDEKFLRDCFKKMFKLKEKIKSNNYERISMEYLSMGMSNDYEIAIEEGSNMVRVGTKIFGNRNYN